MAKLLNWTNFARRLGKNPVFTPLDVRRAFGVSRQTATLALHRYGKRSLIERLKKGLYAFPGSSFSDPYLANRLYSPSYVSLEFALSYHGVIPETVYTITSVTPKATRTFTVRAKTFSYHRIKAEAFTGYKVEKQGGLSFYIADPEKAFVDLTYLRLRSGVKPLNRFRKEKLNVLKTLRYAHLFGNPKLIAVVKRTLR